MIAPRFTRKLFRFELWQHWFQAHPLQATILGVIGFIAVTIAAAVYADALVVNYSFTLGQPAGIGAHVTVTQTLNQYDARHYIDIAEDGYHAVDNAAFLPLYPLLVHMVAIATGLSVEWAALLVSWVALLGAGVVLMYWLRLEIKLHQIRNISPWLILGIIAIFPTAFYFALAYTESLFVLLTVGSLWLYRRGNYAGAGVLAALSAVTRYQGVVLAVFFLADYVFAARKDWRKLIPFVCAGAGLLAYMAYLAMHYGSPFEFLLAEKQWQRLSGNVVLNLIRSFTPVYAWFVAVFGVGLWGVWRYLGKAYFVYSLVFILLPLSSGRFDSINRYMLSLAPLFLGLAIVGTKVAPKPMRLIYIVSSAFLLGWSIMLFANGYWVA